MAGPVDSACIFCKIAAGQIPCHKLYEDATVLAFLDIGPLSRGHALVIPRAHYGTLDQTPPEVTQACVAAAARLARAIQAATGAAAWNLLQNNGQAAGQVVPHVHFHVIPRAAGDGLGYRWNAGKLEAAAAEGLLKAIRSQLA